MMFGLNHYYWIYITSTSNHFSYCHICDGIYMWALNGFTFISFNVVVAIQCDFLKRIHSNKNRASFCLKDMKRIRNKGIRIRNLKKKLTTT